jgi:hypothetical protein
MYRYGSAGFHDPDTQECTQVNVRANASTCVVYGHVRFAIPTDSADADIAAAFRAHLQRMSGMVDESIARMRADPSPLGMPGTG